MIFNKTRLFTQRNIAWGTNISCIISNTKILPMANITFLRVSLSLSEEFWLESDHSFWFCQVLFLEWKSDIEVSKHWSFAGTGMTESLVLLLIRKSITDGGYFRLTADVSVFSSDFSFNSSSFWILSSSSWEEFSSSSTILSLSLSTSQNLRQRQLL